LLISEANVLESEVLPVVPKDTGWWGAAPPAAAWMVGHPAIADGVRSKLFAEQRFSFVCQVLDQQQASRMIDRFQGDSRTNLLQAPKVTVFNGQTAFVEDGSQSLFVVGVKKVKGDTGPVLQPQTRVVFSGTRVSMRPILLENGYVRLECRLMASRIGEVKTKKLKQTSAGSDITIQMPGVITREVETSAEMQPGQTLAIAGLEKEVGPGKSEPMIVMIRPTIREKKDKGLVRAMLK